jgi:hypothetical protein
VDERKEAEEKKMAAGNIDEEDEDDDAQWDRGSDIGKKLARGKFF